LAARLALDGARLQREAEALRLELDGAEAAWAAIAGRLALAEAGRVGEGLLWMARAVDYSPPDDEALLRIIRMNLDAWPSWMARLEDERPFQGNSRLSPDGQLVAAAEEHGPWRIVRVSDGRTSGPELPSGVRPQAFSADGKLLLVVSRDGTRLQAWDTVAATPAAPAIDLPEKWSVRAFSPDGSLLASATAARDGGSP